MSIVVALATIRIGLAVVNGVCRRRLAGPGDKS